MKEMYRAKNGVVVMLDGAQWIVAERYVVPPVDVDGKVNKMAGTETLDGQRYYSDCAPACLAAAKRVARKDAGTLKEYVKGLRAAAADIAAAVAL